MAALPHQLLGPLLPSLPMKGGAYRKNYVVRATAVTPLTKPPSIASANIPLLSAAEVYERMASQRHSNMVNYHAMYSSVVGGITKEPAAMVVPLDDHMVHRGHGVFDTALVWEGHMYELEPHLDRFLRSAAKAKIPLPCTRDDLRVIILETAAVSGMRRGHMRYWLSVGPGGFSLSTKECQQSTFYVMAIGGKTLGQPTEGVKVVTSKVSIKPPEFATQKSVNYLPNAMVLWEAEQEGAAAGIWLDQSGFIGEGQSMNCAFVNKERVLLVPQFDTILAGCTMQRVVQLAQQLVAANGSAPAGSSGLAGVQVRRVAEEEARGATEMMLCGSGVMVEPVTSWDGCAIGDGRPGPVALALRALLEADLEHAPPPLRVPIAYR